MKHLPKVVAAVLGLLATSCDSSGSIDVIDDPHPVDDPFPYPEPPPAPPPSVTVPPPVAVPCNGLEICHGACIEVWSDPQNCGGCDQPCPEGDTCQSGRCSSDCVAADTLCDRTCRNLQTDHAHCGDCGHACDTGEICSDGSCICTPGSIVCEGACVDTNLDARHCGVCGHACEGQMRCRQGACVAATSDWTSSAANMQRTSFNAIERGVPPLSADWNVELPSSVTGLVVEGERAFVTTSGSSFDDMQLIALDVASGTTAWQHDFLDVDFISAPVVADGRVYLIQGVARAPDLTSLPSRLWSFDAASGDTIWSVPTAFQNRNAGAPLITRTAVYTRGEGGAGLTAHDRLSGQHLFDFGEYAYGAGAVSGDDEPAIFANGQITLHGSAAGAIRSTVIAPNTVSPSMVFSQAGLVYFTNSTEVFAVRTATQEIVWTRPAKFGGQPTLVGDQLLHLDGGVLVSVEAASGTERWRCSGAPNLRSAVVAAAGFAYATDENLTYAIDLRDGTVVGKPAGAGGLTIAAGRLFVLPIGRRLFAYKLTSPAETALR